MQLGREPEAKLQLEAAFKADPFHVRVSNALKVLKHLDGYESRETPHFVIKFDPKTDEVLAAWLADYLEELHAEFSKLYGFAPPGKILVEVLATREMFSGRVLSLPGLPGAAAGASTGPLIAIPSPRADGMAKPYNWAVVVRHELTHAFNLTQTGFLVPIWLTEGLAVRAEATRRFDAAANILRDRLADGTAFDLDTIARGYHNFGNPHDVMLAYHQGFLYVEYIETTHGEEAIAKLLEAFQPRPRCQRRHPPRLRHREGRAGEGLSRIPPRTGQGRAAKREADDVRRTGSRAQEVPGRRRHRGAARRRVRPPRQAGRCAEARRCGAREGEGPPGASLVKARLLQRDKDVAGAKGVLEEAAKTNPDDVRVLAALGRLQVEMKELAAAAATFEAIRARGGAEQDVLETLAQLHDAAKQSDKLEPVLAELAARAPIDLALRLRLAKLHSENGGRPEKVEHWAREALFVDVMNEEARGMLLAALRVQKKDGEAEKVEARYR